MISYPILAAIFIIHWIADFVCQTHWQAVNKSSNNDALTQHVASYTCVWWIAIWIYIMCQPVYEHAARLIALFAPITYLCHWGTDYVTSRLVKEKFAKGDYHNGFVIIGIDQMLHYAQLIITYEILK